MTDEQNLDRTRNTDRAAETSERRRNRKDVSSDPSLRRYGVSDDILDQNKFVYRSAVDDGMRLLQLTENDDYDFVTVKGDKVAKADAPGVLKYQSGRGVDGAPVYTYLLRKLKQFATEDRKRKDADIAAAEKARDKPSDAPDQSYTPKR